MPREYIGLIQTWIRNVYVKS